MIASMKRAVLKRRKTQNSPGNKVLQNKGQYLYILLHQNVDDNAWKVSK